MADDDDEEFLPAPAALREGPPPPFDFVRCCREPAADDDRSSPRSSLFSTLSGSCRRLEDFDRGVSSSQSRVKREKMLLDLDLAFFSAMMITLMATVRAAAWENQSGRGEVSGFIITEDFVGEI